MGPSDSTAMGWKIYWVPRFAYLAVSRSAADSAADPSLLAAASRYDIATGQTAVTSHVRGLPPAHGINVFPAERLPSVRDIPLGFLVTGMRAERNDKAVIYCVSFYISSKFYNFRRQFAQYFSGSSIVLNCAT